MVVGETGRRRIAADVGEGRMFEVGGNNDVAFYPSICKVRVGGFQIAARQAGHPR